MKGLSVFFSHPCFTHFFSTENTVPVLSILGTTSEIQPKLLNTDVLTEGTVERLSAQNGSFFYFVT